ncbi:MAG: NTP transferase domain-containing protein, partial [Bdellovibrionales bacterium]|nr:NTP transferase domain-containing protein [Bdellovibrionales bacterium]
MKRIVGVIPARFGAKRFPGKPLVKICGKPMLQWVIEGVRSSSSLTEMMVATDHDEIRQLADSCGVKAIMTRSDLASGSDRVWEAVKEIDCDIVVNIQGDEPLIRGSLVDQLVEPFLGGEEVEMTTLGRSLQDGDLDSLSTAKIVLNRRHE